MTTSQDTILKNARTFAALTLVSRILGLLRDAILARLFGLTALGSAWNIAFQFPNTFRRLFGEGALSAAFIPQYAQLLKHDPALAQRFASLIVALASLGLGAALLILEALVLAILFFAPLTEEGRQATLLLAIMLPFMPLVCVTALLGGMLQTIGRFAAQAGAPILLNLCMILAALLGSRALQLQPERTAILVAVSVVIAGALQTLWCLRDLKGRAAWTLARQGTREPMRKTIRALGPVIVGLGAVQIAVLIESWIIVAWPLYQGDTILGYPYPLDAAAAAALGNAQRLYQFPLGIFGIALATAAFPALARIADEPARFAQTLRKSIRLAALLGVPSTLGLIWTAHDLATVVYQGGAINAEDVSRIEHALQMYALLVGTYSIIHVITRAFYAKENTALPMRVSIASIVLSLMLGVALMFPMGEAGLALGSSLASALQLLFLAAAANRTLRAPAEPLLNRPTIAAIARCFLASGFMLVTLALWRTLSPFRSGDTWLQSLISLAIDAALGAASYAAAAYLLCRQDLQDFLGSARRTKNSPGPSLHQARNPDDH